MKRRIAPIALALLVSAATAAEAQRRPTTTRRPPPARQPSATPPQPAARTVTPAILSADRDRLSLRPGERATLRLTGTALDRLRVVELQLDGVRVPGLQASVTNRGRQTLTLQVEASKDLLRHLRTKGARRFDLVALDGRRRVTFPIYLEILQGPLPDLVPTDLRLAVGAPGQSGKTFGAPVYTNSTVAVSVRATNQGEVTAEFPDQSGVLHWRLIETPPGTSAVGIFPCGRHIAPGQECGGGINFIDPGDVPAGSHLLRLMIDPYDEVEETDETNNTMDLVMEVGQAEAQTGVPDLVIEEVTEVEGSLRVTVRNQGNGDAFFEGNSHLVEGDAPYGHYRLVGSTWIMAGETLAVELDGGACPEAGVQSVSFQADPQDRVVESDEGNNGSTVTLSAPLFDDSSADLVVDSVTFTPTNPTTDDQLSIRVDMRNQGQGPARFCRMDGMWMSISQPPGVGGGGTHVQDEPRMVGPGETFFGGLITAQPGELEPGSYQVTATVDPQDAVNETNEGNNSRTVTLTVE